MMANDVVERTGAAKEVDAPAAQRGRHAGGGCD